METETKADNSKKRLIILATVGFAAAVALGIGAAWAATVVGKNDLRTVIQQAAQEHVIRYPLFYPSRLPDGFSVADESVAAPEGNVIHFVLISGDKKIFVTEQARPPIMEEVTKTQEFTTSAGPAYIAELSGRAVGFLVAPETLVIVSSPDQIDPVILRRVIEAMTPLF